MAALALVVPASAQARPAKWSAPASPAKWSAPADADEGSPSDFRLRVQRSSWT